MRVLESDFQFLITVLLPQSEAVEKDWTVKHCWEAFRFVFVLFSTILAPTLFEIFIQLFYFLGNKKNIEENWWKIRSRKKKDFFPLACFMHEAILKYDHESVEICCFFLCSQHSKTCSGRSGRKKLLTC